MQDGAIKEGIAEHASTRFWVRGAAEWPPGSVLQVVGGFGLLGLAARVCVPVPGTDVPATLQLLAVVWLGLTWRRGAAFGAVALYLTCGGLEWGVFAPGSAGLSGPTGGYLLGFLPAVLVAGWLRGASGAAWWRLWCAGLAAAIVVLAAGVLGRLVWLGDWSVAVATGLLPFLAKSIVEVTLAVLLVRGGRKAIHHAPD